MGKKVLIALLLILAICSGSAFADLNEAKNKLSEIESNIVIALMPFDGANGVNMRDTRYPLRENVVTPGNNPVSTDELDYAEGTSLNNYIGATTSNQYCDQQMILLGGLEGVPTDGYVLSTRWTAAEWYYPEFRITYTTETPNKAYIEFLSSTDFMYVSQSNPIYQRPYAVHVARRYGSSGDQNTVSNHTSDPFITLDSDNYFEGAELEMHQGGGDFTSSWFDLVLALPYDSVNSITETGVTYKNIEYPLNDTADYSSVLTVTMSWEQPYVIEQNHGRPISGEDWRVVEGTAGVLKRSMSMAIPFSGFSSTIETGPSDATASLTISLFPAASNLSLNDADTNREVKVAELDFIMNLPDYIKDNNDQYYDRDTYKPIDINTNVWLFLSASPDHLNSSSNGFVLVHENAGSMLTSYNSATYEVITKGLGNSATSADGAGGGEVVFDGKAKTLDFVPAGGPSDAYIHTYCNASGGEGSFLPHEKGDFEIGDETFSSNNYHHYHEYRGEVYVKIEPTALKPEGMRAGRYTSEIYVHVMTTD